MAETSILTIGPGSPDIAVIARWRTDAFSVLGGDAKRERRSLEAFVADQADQVALVAQRGGAPVGTCLLVKSEIRPNHAVTPWLAGLFVLPEVRRNGVGALLVQAIEDEARRRGVGRLHLYTGSASGFYARLGWRVVETTRWEGHDTAFVVREL